MLRTLCHSRCANHLPHRSWVQAEADQAPERLPTERMCHSATALPDGRVLLLGGRRKEGICQDIWWLEAPVRPFIETLHVP